MSPNVSESGPQGAYEKGYRDFADCICNLIDEVGGDGPSLYNWSGQTPSAQAVTEHLRQLIETRCDISRKQGKKETESFFRDWLIWQEDNHVILHTEGASIVDSWLRDVEDANVIHTLTSLEIQFSEFGEVQDKLKIVRDALLRTLSTFCHQWLLSQKQS